MGRDRYAQQSLGHLHSRIKQSRILMVGAGGIGCELLKNLVLTGFGEIHVVDLDTIDLSNLNRQFLFRHEHIKKAKALVAKETAARFNPSVKLEAYHANIKDAPFNIEWFKTFDIVFNALDNLDARRHVNRMCLAAEVPLIESGTTGFDGQVQVIKKGKTECYDCNPKPVPKSFPVCTVRSTPSQPIHCIVWAKSYLFTEIFGTSEDESPDLDESEDSENAQEIEKLRQESQALKHIREAIGSSDFAKKIFQKVFKDDINRLRSMEDMWKTRQPPIALDYDKLSSDAQAIDLAVSCQGQKIWTLEETFTVFVASLGRLSDRFKDLQTVTGGITAATTLTFDKDDEDTLDFVAATANLRSIIFGIERRSKFDIKQMAGNIIPAIATTNAMAAGLCVLQAFKVLRDALGKARMVFLEHGGARVINTDMLKPPNPDCSVCGVFQSDLIIDKARATLNDLVEDVLKVQLGYGEEFSVTNEVGTLYDPELDDNLSKKLSDLGIKADSFLTVIDDEEDNPRVNVSFSICEKTLPEDSKPIVIAAGLEITRKPKSYEKAFSFPNGSANSIPTISNGRNMKRKRVMEESLIDLQIDKKGKADADDVVIVESGAIVIDD